MNDGIMILGFASTGKTAYLCSLAYQLQVQDHASGLKEIKDGENFHRVSDRALYKKNAFGKLKVWGKYEYTRDLIGPDSNAIWQPTLPGEPPRLMQLLHVVPGWLMPGVNLWSADMSGETWRAMVDEVNEPEKEMVPILENVKDKILPRASAFIFLIDAFRHEDGNYWTHNWFDKVFEQCKHLNKLKTRIPVCCVLTKIDEFWKDDYGNVRSDVVKEISLSLSISECHRYAPDKYPEEEGRVKYAITLEQFRAMEDIEEVKAVSSDIFQMKCYGTPLEKAVMKLKMDERYDFSIIGVSAWGHPLEMHSSGEGEKTPSVENLQPIHVVKPIRHVMRNLVKIKRWRRARRLQIASALILLLVLLLGPFLYHTTHMLGNISSTKGKYDSATKFYEASFYNPFAIVLHSFRSGERRRLEADVDITLKRMVFTNSESGKDLYEQANRLLILLPSSELRGELNQKLADSKFSDLIRNNNMEDAATMWLQEANNPSRSQLELARMLDQIVQGCNTNNKPEVLVTIIEKEKINERVGHRLRIENSPLRTKYYLASATYYNLKGLEDNAEKISDYAGRAGETELYFKSRKHLVEAQKSIAVNTLRNLRQRCEDDQKPENLTVEVNELMQIKEYAWELAPWIDLQLGKLGNELISYTEDIPERIKVEQGVWIMDKVFYPGPDQQIVDSLLRAYLYLKGNNIWNKDGGVESFSNYWVEKVDIPYVESSAQLAEFNQNLMQLSSEMKNEIRNNFNTLAIKDIEKNPLSEMRRIAKIQYSIINDSPLMLAETQTLIELEHFKRNISGVNGEIDKAEMVQPVIGLKNQYGDSLPPHISDEINSIINEELLRGIDAEDLKNVRIGTLGLLEQDVFSEKAYANTFIKLLNLHFERNDNEGTQEILNWMGDSSIAGVPENEILSVVKDIYKSAEIEDPDSRVNELAKARENLPSAHILDLESYEFITRHLDVAYENESDMSIPLQERVYYFSRTDGLVNRSEYVKKGNDLIEFVIANKEIQSLKAVSIDVINILNAKNIPVSENNTESIFNQLKDMIHEDVNLTTQVQVFLKSNVKSEIDRSAWLNQDFKDLKALYELVGETDVTFRDKVKSQIFQKVEDIERYVEILGIDKVNSVDTILSQVKKFNSRILKDWILIKSPLENIPPLYFQAHEVLVADYLLFINSNPVFEFREGMSRSKKDNLPLQWEDQLRHSKRGVVWIDWWDSVAYCSFYHPDARLPTLDEWLLAAFGPPPSRMYPTNNISVDSVSAPGRILSSPRGMDDGATDDMTPDGILFMSGNLKEWGFNGPTATNSYILGVGFRDDARAIRNILNANQIPNVPKLRKSEDVGFRMVAPIVPTILDKWL